MDSAALLAHIVSQTRQNVEFLISQNQISPDNGREILSKLPSSIAASRSGSSTLSLTQDIQNLAVSTPQVTTIPVATTPNSVAVSNTPHSVQPPQAPPPAAPRVLFQAKASWNYNEQGQNPNDLSFYAGETIDVIAETNADWWSGIHKGKQGLFPANYVEKIPPSSFLPSPAPTPYSEKVQGGAGYPMAPYSSYQPTGGYHGPPPPAQPNANANPDEPNSPKKGKFGGKLGNTLAHSAVGGVGFGAGSAIGSGLINSIF